MKKALLYLFLILCYSSAYADTDQGTADDSRALKVVVPYMGDAPGQGPEHPLVEVVRQWSEESGRQITIERFPFKRSLMMAATGEADFHFPLIKDRKATDTALPFGYSSSTLFTINFVLYTRSEVNLDIDNLQNYRLATYGGHADLFPFPISEDYSIEGSLRKVDSGRIDGFIFADSGADPVLFELGLMGIKRQLYKVYDVHAVISHQAKKGPIDQFITEVSANMDRTILGLAMVDQPYLDWQMGDDSVPALVQAER